LIAQASHQWSGQGPHADLHAEHRVGDVDHADLRAEHLPGVVRRAGHLRAVHDAGHHVGHASHLGSPAVRRTRVVRNPRQLKPVQAPEHDVADPGALEAVDVTRDEDKAPKLIGYHVNNSVFITVRDISKLGDVLDKIVSLGANSIGGISFGVANREAVENEARKLAMADAITKAKLFAQAAGAELGDVLTISEQGGYQPCFEKRAAAPMAAAAPVPIEAGTEAVGMQVSVTWELK